jgi:sirohydrochlorin cobaltochelatase
LKPGVILFAHGSRDPQWARPFERLAATVSRKLPGSEVKLAFLELMQPSLQEAVAALHERGINNLRVVPVFLGQGSHLKEDLPKLVAAASAAHPGVKICLDKAIGEQDRVVEAIAEVISAGSPRRASA